ncbi:AMP-binding protein [Streptomyces sp. NPDC046909]|uniref:AMP-binding protein n=1 Tax=Streptomyces sp. NPDC046909 TaxID=3155617 RepID=UPI0033CF50DB
MTHPLIDGLLALPLDSAVLVDATGAAGSPDTCAPVPAARYVDDVRRCAGALAERGVRKGSRVAVTVPANREFMTLVHACHYLGAVPALFDPGLPAEESGRGVDRLGVVLWATAHGAEPGSTPVAALLDGPPVPAPTPVTADDSCLIIHTSGTTGAPKPVVWTCGLVASYLAQQRALYGGGQRLGTEFVVLPFLGLMDAALGRTLVLPRLGDPRPGHADMAPAHRQMTELGCDYTFASLAFWRRLVAYCTDSGLPMPPVRVATVSGAPASAHVVEDLLRALPSTRVDIHYASTEAPIPLAVVDAAELAERAVAAAREGLGVPVGRAQDARIGVLAPDAGALREFDDTDLLPPGRIGELVVSGPRVSRAYAGLPELTAQAKLHHRDGSLWHRMGDIGYVDNSGMVWFLCRRKHLMSLPDGDVHPDQQEFAYNQQLGLTHCALVALPHSDTGRLALIVPAAEAHRASGQSVRELAQRLGWPVPLPVAHPGPLPVDRRHSIKIDRPALAAWLTEGPAYAGEPAPQ